MNNESMIIKKLVSIGITVPKNTSCLTEIRKEWHYNRCFFRNCVVTAVRRKIHFVKLQVNHLKTVLLWGE